MSQVTATPEPTQEIQCVCPKMHGSHFPSSLCMLSLLLLSGSVPVSLSQSLLEIPLHHLEDGGSDGLCAAGIVAGSLMCPVQHSKHLVLFGFVFEVSSHFLEKALYEFTAILLPQHLKC